jgi:hypothetical protein
MRYTEYDMQRLRSSYISIFSTVLGIRIRIDFGRLDPDPHRECGIGSGTKVGKNDPQKQEKGKKMKKFHVLKCWMFSFED